MSHRYPHLLSTGRIGGMEVRNRIAMAAMGTNFAATSLAGFTDKMHQKNGNCLISDGSVQQLSSAKFREQCRNTGDTSSAAPGANTLLFQ